MYFFLNFMVSYQKKIYKVCNLLTVCKLNENDYLPNVASTSAKMIKMKRPNSGLLYRFLTR